MRKLKKLMFHGTGQYIMCLIYNSFIVIYVLIHVGTRNADLSRPNLFLPLPINGYQMANKIISPVCVRLWYCLSTSCFFSKNFQAMSWETSLKEHSRYTEIATIIFCFKKQVRRTPLCLEFGVWDLEFPDKPGPFWFRPGWLV